MHLSSLLYPPYAPQNSIRDLITRMIFGEYRLWSSSLCSFLQSRVTSPFLGQNLSQRPIFEHPQPMFLPQCERQIFSPIRNNRQNYRSVYLDFSVFEYQTGSQKILQWMIASIPWSQYLICAVRFVSFSVSLNCRFFFMFMVPCIIIYSMK